MDGDGSEFGGGWCLGERERIGFSTCVALGIFMQRSHLPFQTRVDGKALFLLTPHHCVYMAFTIRLAFKAPTKGCTVYADKGLSPQAQGPNLGRDMYADVAPVLSKYYRRLNG